MMAQSNEPDAGDGGAGAPPEPNESNRAPERTRRYTQGELTVRWYAKRCIHSAECIRAAPRVFDPRRRPWIDLTQDDVERITQAVDACPTGALEYTYQGRTSEQMDVAPEVYAVPGGPYYCRGSFRIVDEDGTLLRETTRIALCRCGKSANMPFCDNSHRAKGPGYRINE